MKAKLIDFFYENNYPHTRIENLSVTISNLYDCLKLIPTEEKSIFLNKPLITRLAEFAVHESTCNHFNIKINKEPNILFHTLLNNEGISEENSSLLRLSISNISFAIGYCDENTIQKLKHDLKLIEKEIKTDLKETDLKESILINMEELNINTEKIPKEEVSEK